LYNTHDAADATQEIFVKVYRHLDQYNETKASIKTWIYRIAIHHCLDVLKSKNNRQKWGKLVALFKNETTEPIGEAVHFNHPGVQAEDKQAVEQLLGLIASLPQNQKTALILSKLEGYSQQEIADIMTISTKAVESLLQRAKQNLWKKLHPNEG
jgi:RNA polymerase sigma factor (sigma-70 family)